MLIPLFIFFGRKIPVQNVEERFMETFMILCFALLFGSSISKLIKKLNEKLYITFINLGTISAIYKDISTNTKVFFVY